MRGLVLPFCLALTGLVVTVGIYSYYPLPASGTSWTSPSLWLAVGLLAVGLVCFVVVLVTGLVLVLNWYSDAHRERRRSP